MKKSLFFKTLLLGAVIPALWAGGKGDSFWQKAEKPLVGISMPTQGETRWNFDGAYLKAQLQKAGFQVDLQYAQNNSRLQSEQIRRLAERGSRFLVVAPVEAGALIGALEDAAGKGARIIAYNQLITGTAAVECLVFFDPYHIGIAQGNIVSDTLGLYRGTTGPLNLEFVTGPQTDLEAVHIFAGSNAVLKRYVDAGIIAVPSLKYPFPPYKDALRWTREAARTYMADILATVYPGGTGPNNRGLDAILTGSDTIALGVIDALKAAGYGQGAGKIPLPVIAGQGCDLSNVRVILAGDQTGSVFMDPRLLAHRTVDIIQTMAGGGNLPAPSTGGYHNGVKQVPAFLCTPRLVYRSTVREVLVDSGYYTTRELGLK
ncbi:MAG: sugar-binding protein [Spirochaetaceae bacterium]|jgi:putative multiple sugar transport system substrate-binding protein|nr:sugar-binding protein [Spirochaetaceae bacterium]